MKSIDFTKPGGFPLTQDQLGYLQTAYSECLKALALGGYDSGSAAPAVVSGMAVTMPTAGTYSVSDGWFLYGGDMVRFTGSTLTPPGGDNAYIVITPAAGTLAYNDGSTPAVILDKSAALQALPAGTATDATHCLLSALLPFGYGFGVNNREQVWQSMTVSTAAADGGVTGTVYYKKDFTANTMQLRGVLSANNAQNFAASPGALFSLMGTFPAGYVPNNSVFFIASYYVSGLIKDDLGIAWIKQVNCGINTGGQFFVNWLRPDTAISAYGVTFNTIVPLD